MGGRERMSERVFSNDLQNYVKAWYAKMAEIWCDRIDLLGIKDTGALAISVRNDAFNFTGDSWLLSFRYLEYGIYVDLGVGNGYKHDNGGDLAFLSDAYRYEHKKGKKRKKRPWFNKSWYISQLILKEKLAEIIGDEFSGMFDNLTNRERG